jgi:hypothetical protein
MDYTLKIEETCFSATLLHTYQNTWCHNTADNNVNRLGSFENTEMKTVGPKRMGSFFDKKLNGRDQLDDIGVPLFIMSRGGGVRLSPLGTSATNCTSTG